MLTILLALIHSRAINAAFEPLWYHYGITTLLDIVLFIVIVIICTKDGHSTKQTKEKDPTS